MLDRSGCERPPRPPFLNCASDSRVSGAPGAPKDTPEEDDLMLILVTERLLRRLTLIFRNEFGPPLKFHLKVLQNVLFSLCFDASEITALVPLFLREIVIAVENDMHADRL
jgi:hypothetical protein